MRDLAPEETHALRREVSAGGRTDIQIRSPLDGAPGAWHLGAMDAAGVVIAISSYYRVTCPVRPDARPAVQLQNMAVAPGRQRQGVGSAVLDEAIRRLRTGGGVFLWASARDAAIPFYERFGFAVLEGSASASATGPHHLIALDLRAAD